jgi:hypothetical protein
VLGTSQQAGVLPSAIPSPVLQVALLEGMESLNQAKVGSALQVFYNLEELPQVSRRDRAGWGHGGCM